MNTMGFQRSEGERAVANWRPLDQALYRWVLAHGGDALLARCAAWASLADGEGDSALRLGDGRRDMPALGAVELAQLRASPLVARDEGEGQRPFVLDAQGRFYLWRNHANEVEVAAQVLARRAASTAAEADLQASIDALFHAQRDEAVALQRAAVGSVAGKSLFVLTGGPGTGKTTTVLRMLLMLQMQATQPLTIQIAAPTGKAARRLAEALRIGKQTLRERAPARLSGAWQVWFDRIAEERATTLHRLLGYQPWRNAFARGEHAPLVADVVVVDEASMVDLAMLRHLLGALRPSASLILVGDADQLSSVATGSVLADLVAAFEVSPRGDLVRLTHSFRAERELVAVNEAVRVGNPARLTAALADSAGKALWRCVDGEKELRAHLQRWSDELALHLRTPALADAQDVAGARSALAALAGRQLLCALRETAFGTVAVNARIEASLRKAWQVASEGPWFAGRAVIITRNDPGTGLANGDVGVCLADRSGSLRVWFDGNGEAASAGPRGFLPQSLPAHESAFALTIHKSQGSEYAQVAVLLPPDATHRILSRQLLYTAVSRARQSLEIWSASAVLEAAVRTEAQRSGGLFDRLNQDPPEAR
ncbi:MAG: exodeoxyribonuclease V subunit alpha [Dokdonella sp.]|uniref:exodeoxyribonuclease V subunit alpha n=1 Tax=Dokdonella sp. TaxID=2291710 RepID=UPI0025C44065|nr:exodeoxyribonuclease V subunit alpha [Dokdonella sp.]MBZ0223292.1 exodeoxyribonuclease V subunit alpha [Dokdonella sp.]